MTAGAWFRMYGGDEGSNECRYELRRWTKVDFPAPAMPIVIMVTGFFLSPVGADDDDAEAACSASIVLAVSLEAKRQRAKVRVPAKR